MKTLMALVLAALAGSASAQVVHVWLPDTLPAHGGDTITVPVMISDHVGQGVVAVDLAVGLDSVRLALPDSSVLQGDAVPSGWFVYATPFRCSLLVAMAGIDPLKTGDTLLKFRVVVDTASGVAPIEILRCQLNEGQVACSTSNGVIGMAEPVTRLSRRSSMGVFPNPTAGPTRISLMMPAGGHTTVTLVDAIGTKVRSLAVPTKGECACVAWDGCDDAGRRVGPGVYFVREEPQASGFKPQAVRKVVVAR